MASNISSNSTIDLQALSVYYIRMLGSLPPFLGETFFPQRKVGKDQLKYYIQKQSANFLASEGSIDVTSVTPDNYDGFSDQMFDTRMFTTSGVISEQDLTDINNAIASSDDALYINLVMSLYKSQSQQLLKQRSRREWMAMNALVNSRIDFDISNPIEYAYTKDFQVDGDDWSNPDTDIFKDITHAMDAMKKKGLNPNQMIMNITTFRNMQKNKKIKATYSAVGTNTDNFMMLQGNLVDAIKSEFRITPVVYDQGYNLKDENDITTFKEYIPDGMVILLNGPIDPNYAMNGTSGIVTQNIGNPQSIGEMVFAPTPEELKARNNSLNGDLQLFDTGVAFHTYENDSNAQTESRTAQKCLPAFEQSRSIFRMNVGSVGNDGKPKKQPTPEKQSDNSGDQSSSNQNNSGNKQPATA